MKKNKNKLCLWEPIGKLTLPMFVEAVYDDWEGFRILMKGESKSSRMLRITFNDVLSYRNTDESYLLKIWHTSEKQNLGRIFYTIEDSDYIEFFQEMTQGLYLDWKITHYAIYTISDCIDILSQSTPNIEWLD